MCLHLGLNPHYYFWCQWCLRGKTACQTGASRVIVSYRCFRNQPRMYSRQPSFAHQVRLAMDYLDHCRMAVVPPPGTMAATGLALIWVPRRTLLCNLGAIARTVDSRHHERRRLSNPAQIVSQLVRHVSVATASSASRKANHEILKRTWWKCSILNDIFEREFCRDCSPVLLSSFDVYLTLSQVHGPGSF